MAACFANGALPLRRRREESFIDLKATPLAGGGAAASGSGAFSPRKRDINKYFWADSVGPAAFNACFAGRQQRHGPQQPQQALRSGTSPFSQ